MLLELYVHFYKSTVSKTGFAITNENAPHTMIFHCCTRKEC